MEVSVSAQTFEAYSRAYEHVNMERRNGILQVTLHTGGGELVWGFKVLSELPRCFADIGNDPENKVVILTGSGRRFVGHREPFSGPPSATDWVGMMRDAQQLNRALLDIDAPMIAAFNGPSNEHAELGLLCDIVLATDDTTFRDAAHMQRGLAPGDGCQVVWPMLLGPNRGRYFLLTGQTITAAEALQLGIVSEVLPRDQLLRRAWELADYIRQRPAIAVRLTRSAITMELKRQMQAYMGYGLALEAIGGIDEFPPLAEDEL
jgi:enoyl-CoA hydratase/carnithine racemase